MSVQPIPFSGRRADMLAAQEPITRRLVGAAARRAGRALVRLSDWLFEITGEVVLTRDCHSLALAHDDHESALEAEALAKLADCGRCRLTVLPLLLRAEAHDDAERHWVERAERHAEAAQTFATGLLSRTERRRIRLLPRGGPEGAA